jgi:outer membrane lipoprotein carrier protein
MRQVRVVAQASSLPTPRSTTLPAHPAKWNPTLRGPRRGDPGACRPEGCATLGSANAKCCLWQDWISLIASSLSFLLVAFSPLTVHATAVDQLKSFIQTTRSARADFSQAVFDRSGKKLQQASGTMAFSRPGKFRWAYQKPYEQLIVGDGESIWVYDKELDQVTVKRLDRALGSSPAALLAGSNEIENRFDLRDAGSRHGLEWLEATPKDKESTFESVRMGFDGESLVAMELRDHFGQTTTIRFSDVEKNPSLAPELFQFAPPKGADVIRD